MPNDNEKTEKYTIGNKDYIVITKASKKSDENINGNKNIESIKNEIKHKPFCAYFTLK